MENRIKKLEEEVKRLKVLIKALKLDVFYLRTLLRLIDKNDTLH